MLLSSSIRPGCSVLGELSRSAHSVLARLQRCVSSEDAFQKRNDLLEGRLLGLPEVEHQDPDFHGRATSDLIAQLIQPPGCLESAL